MTAFSLPKPSWLLSILDLVVLLALPHEVHAGYPPASTTCARSANSTGWSIRNFTFDTNLKLYYGEGTAGKVSFSIKNLDNGYEFDCAQGNAQGGHTPNFSLKDGKVWYSCNSYCYGSETNPPLDTEFNFNINTKMLSLSQKWTCAGQNMSAPTTFLGTGSAVVDNLSCLQVPNGRPDQVSCAPIDVNVKASSVQAVNSTANSEPTAADGAYPPRTTADERFISSPPTVLHDTPSCSQRSRSPSWTVGRVTYNLQGVRFMLTNTAINYTTQCNIQDFIDGVRHEAPRWRNCTRYSPNHVSYPNDGIYTEVLYGGAGDVLGVNQTWYCDDEDKTKATTFSVWGETTVRFNCDQIRSCYPASSPDEQPSIGFRDNCSLPAYTLMPNKTVTTSIAPDRARSLFTPRGYNCTARSLGSQGVPSWEVGGFTFNRTWTTEWDRFQDEAGFMYNNTAINSEWPMIDGDRECYDQSSLGAPLFDGSWQLHCLSGIRDVINFRFDYSRSLLTISQVWGCDGMDKAHANYFNATGSVVLPLQCTPAGNGTRCTGPGKISVPMGNLVADMNSEPETWDPGYY
ncbi:hypothetical protein GQ53DRAFT_818071 [Thozetella sp. PMI_491]|nr:hypothetical protein GQ53DRAFT_818071 [Thozetella sp. PMI_491]